MSGIRIDLRSLELFKEQLKRDSSLTVLIPDITLAIEKFANQFENRFQQVYRTSARLEDLRFGGKVKPSEIGKTYLRYGLQYRFKPTKLTDFSYITMPSRSISYAHIFQHRIKGMYSRGVVSKVTKRKGSFQVDRLTGQKVFLVDGKLKSRTVDATWVSKPGKGFKGERTKVQTAVGIPLNILAGGLVQNDTEVTTYLDQFEVSLVNIFSNFYIR